jgi:hypothetical protein
VENQLADNGMDQALRLAVRASDWLLLPQVGESSHRSANS